MAVRAWPLRRLLGATFWSAERFLAVMARPKLEGFWLSRSSARIAVTVWCAENMFEVSHGVPNKKTST